MYDLLSFTNYSTSIITLLFVNYKSFNEIIVAKLVNLLLLLIQLPLSNILRNIFIRKNTWKQPNRQPSVTCHWHVTTNQKQKPKANTFLLFFRRNTIVLVHAGLKKRRKYAAIRNIAISFCETSSPLLSPTPPSACHSIFFSFHGQRTCVISTPVIHQAPASGIPHKQDTV